MQPKTVPEALEAAADVMEKGWTRNVLARAADGRPVFMFAAEAAKFCVIGALVLVTKESPRGIYSDAVLALTHSMGGGRDFSLIDWNNSQISGRPVVRALRRVAKEVRDAA